MAPVDEGTAGLRRHLLPRRHAPTLLPTDL